MNPMKDIRLWGILILALAVRTVMLFSVFQDVRRAVTPDSGDYDELALHWSDTGAYARSSGGFSVVEGGRILNLVSPKVFPEVFRTPGYPGLLVAANRFDTEPRWISTSWDGSALESAPLSPQAQLASTADRIVLSFQVLLDLHLVLLTFFLGRSLAGHGTGLLAALLQAVSPLAAAASCRILTDGIFAFMLTAALLLLIRHFRMGGRWSLLAAALVMGAACYVRPVSLAFSAVMALVIVCSRRGTGILPVSSMGVPPMPKEEKTTGETPVELTGKMPVLRPMRLLRTAAFACVVIACIAPWVARNIIVADYWGFSSFATDSMYWYSAAEIEGRRQGKSVEDIRRQFADREGWKELHEGWKRFPDFGPPPTTAPCSLTPGDLVRYRWDRARPIILAHPWDFLDIHLRGDLAFWLPGAPDALEVMGYTSGGKGTLDVLHREGIFAATKHYFGDNTTAMVLAGGMVVIMLVRYLGLILCGLWRLRPGMTAAGWLCLLLVVTAWLLPGPANHPRFRVPVEPILSAAAAIGYIGLIEWRRRRRTEDKTAEQG